jgi:formamidopyrimidine-DNA glycosylase
MPELPEVERGRRLAERVAAGRRIVRAWPARDAIVYEGVSSARFRRAVTGRRVVAVRRWGKHIWFELDERPWPLFHFGMTGSFRTPGEDPLRLAADGRRALVSDWPPPFTKLRLALDDGGELVMVNKRRLGRIRLRMDPPVEPPIADLGFDPLFDLPSPRTFAERVAGRTVTLKGLLLDQGFAAGVGNWIADEVLYQAKLDPRRRAATLDDLEIRRLRNALGRIVRRAVQVDADKRRFPRTWLFHHRWGKREKARTSRGERIAFLTLAGRTTAWVPAAQR